MKIGGGILDRLRRRRPKPLDMDRFGWAAKPLKGPRLYYILSDEEFEAKAVALGREKTDEAFTAWGAFSPVMYLRARSAGSTFIHELRHVTEGQFHD